MISDWAPTVAAVGALLRSRTVDRGGNELGTFTAETRPTGDQVTDLIAQAGGTAASWAGADLAEPIWPMAAAYVAIRAALLVELTYFPEQVATGRSPYAELKALADEQRKDLAGAISEAGGNPAGGGTEPRYAFPTTLPISLDTPF
jgi:hypothetical protein